MKIHFDDSAMKSFINNAVSQAWDNQVQDTAYLQLVNELKQAGIQFSDEQIHAVKIAFNHLGMMTTKQSLIAMVHLLDELGLAHLD